MDDLKRAAKNMATEDVKMFTTKLKKTTIDRMKAHCVGAGYVLWRWLDKIINEKIGSCKKKSLI